MSYEYSDDRDRIDAQAAWDFLSTSAYWARWRTRQDFDRQLAEAWRVVGCYEAGSGAMVGFARAVSDGVALAYLADVFVLPEHRGQGLGARLVEVMVEEGPGADFRWMLHTADAHELYRRFGFAEPVSSVLERPHASARRT
jgi:GNAT superfamily N-acetyltransferase